MKRTILKLTLMTYTICALPSYGAIQMTLSQGHLKPTQPFSKGMSVGLIHQLSFGIVVAGAPMDIVIPALDSNAAVFVATGDPDTEVIAKITKRAFRMRNGRSKIKVNSFTYGGDIHNKLAVFHHDGHLNNLRVGATAHLKAGNKTGDYSGQVKFRLTTV